MPDLIEAAAPTEPSPAPRRRFGPRAAVVAVVAVVALLAVVAAAGVRWLRNPSTFEPYVGVNVMATAPVDGSVYTDTQVTQRIPADGIEVPPRMVTVLSATPRITNDTARARVELLLCTRNGSTTAVGLQYGGLGESCSSVVPLTTPSDITFSFMTAQLILRVTGERRGTVEVDGVDIEYRDGLQGGVQHVGGGVRIEFVPADEIPAPTS